VPEQNRPGAVRQAAPLAQTLTGVVMLVSAYALVHAVARLLASGNLGEDDPLDNLLIQQLAAGYRINQPPLYDWVLWLLQQGLGAGVVPFLLLKYGLLVVIAGFLFSITRRVSGSALWGLLAVDAMALVYQIFWRFHEGFTHRVGAITLALATLWAVLRLIDHGRRRDYLVLGMCIGFGLLSEGRYTVLLVALAAAAALQPQARARLRSPWLLSVFVVAAVIVAPYAVWLLGDSIRQEDFLASLWPTAAPLAKLGSAIGTALVNPLLALSPYIFILPLLFPALARTVWRETPLRPNPALLFDPGQLILHALLAQWAWLLVVDGLLLRHAHYPVHSLLPMFVIALVWLAEKTRQSAPTPRQIRRFVAFSLVVTVIAFGGRLANMFVLDPVCTTCRWGVPYTELAGAMRAAGFEGGIVLSPEVDLAGNLRRFFPKDTFIVPAAGSLPPSCEQAVPVAIVWSARHDEKAVFDDLRGYLPPTYHGALPVHEIRISWRHLWKPDGYRHSDWRLVVVPAR